MSWGSGGGGALVALLVPSLTSTISLVWSSLVEVSPLRCSSLCVNGGSGPGVSSPQPSHMLCTNLLNVVLSVEHSVPQQLLVALLSI